MGVISNNEVKIDATKLAEHMSTPENKVTKRAIELQWAKLKNLAKDDS